MQETKISLDGFDLYGFAQEMVRFIDNQCAPGANPFDAIVWVSQIGDVPEMGPDAGYRDLVSELLKDQKILFFPFSSTNIGEPISCADGEVYNLADGPPHDFGMGATDCIGYTVQVKDGQIIINSAIYSHAWPPPSTLELLPNAAVFEEPMKWFLKKFVRE